MWPLPGLGDGHETEQVTDLTRNATMPDKTHPAAVVRAEAKVQRVLAQAARSLKNSVLAFLGLPITSTYRLAVQQKLKQIERMEGSTMIEEKCV